MGVANASCSGRPGFAIASAFLLLGAAPGEARAVVHVNAVRVGLHSLHTRLVIESDHPINARATREATTGAVLVDLDDVELDPLLASLGTKIGADNPLMIGAAWSRQTHGVRLTLAERVAVSPRVFNLRPGDGHSNRLVVDLYAAVDRVASAQRKASVDAAPGAMPMPAVSAAQALIHGRAAQSRPSHVSVARIGIATDRGELVFGSDGPIGASLVHPTQPDPLVIELAAVALVAPSSDLASQIRRTPYLNPARFSHGVAGTRLERIVLAPVTTQIVNLKPVNDHGDEWVVDVVPEHVVPMRRLPVDPSSPAPEVVQATLASAASAPVMPTPALVTLHAQTPMTTSEPLSEIWLEVQVNGTPQGTVLLLEDTAGHILVRADDLDRWRIRVAGVAVVSHDGQGYYPLSAISGIVYRVDTARGMLLLDVDGSRFTASQFTGISRGAVEPTPSPFGAYVNYDLFASKADGSSSAAALLEGGVFGRGGSGVSKALVRQSEGRTHTVRLDTLWTYDQPASMASWRVGDSISGSSSWGRSVRFGGVQWATNFATQPSFVTFPLPSLNGVAAEPSTVDFYVNNVLRLRRDVPSGPFTIQDLPIVTGQGEIRMVVRDLVGREQVVTQPFYASGGLLAQGLRDFSYEVGFQRENYGLVSNDYRTLTAFGTERRGLSDRFTGELHAEVTRYQQALGLGGNLLLGRVGVLTASVAASHNTVGEGALVELGFQHQSRLLSFGARTQFTSANFSQLGYLSPSRPPKQTTTAFVGFGAGGFGSMSMNYTYQDYRSQPGVELVGASYSRSLGHLGYVTVSALRFLGSDPSPLFTLNFIVSLGAVDSVGFNAQSHAGSKHGSVQYQHNLPTGTGVGYRLQAGLDADDARQADVTFQNDVGTYSAGLASSSGRNAYQASWSGGVALLSGKAFPSRHIDGSFAVVQVPGFANVRVYADNQQVATTDDAGYALVPRLRPYQKNPIRIEQADLPMDAEVQGLELDAIPYDHSAVSLVFPVARSSGAIVTVMLDDGSFLPAGAEIRIEGSETTYPVGMNGEVYLTGLHTANRLHATWHEQQCSLQLAFSAAADPLPRLGPLTCHGIDP